MSTRTTGPSRGRRLAAVLTAALALGVVPVALAPAAQAALPQCESAFLAWAEYNDQYDWNVHRPLVPGTSTSSSWTRCNLSSGSKGAGVRALQSALNECHGKRLAVDGSFGPATRNAVIEVQRALRISADGVFGPTTSHYMKFPGNWEYPHSGFPRCM